MPWSTAWAVRNSFSASEPSHQKIWSGWQSLASSSTHAMMALLLVLHFPKVSFASVICPILFGPSDNLWQFQFKKKLISKLRVFCSKFTSCWLGPCRREHCQKVILETISDKA